jgi:ABC-type branched-subunit amino acid transport system ATPase component
MLQANGLRKAFGGLTVLDGCDIEIATGSITGIIGPNGAGKSTLFNVLSGHIRADAGEVSFDGKRVAGLRPDQLARAGLVRTFQISRELGALTVLENLLLAAPDQAGESSLRSLFQPARVKAQERESFMKAAALIAEMGLSALIDSPARALSGGQKKLLELARALMLEPRLILLDEPAAGVSPPMISLLCDTIKRLNRQGISFAVVEHDMDMVAALCDRIYFLANGRTLVAGTYREVVADPRVMQAYLGAAA